MHVFLPRNDKMRSPIITDPKLDINTKPPRHYAFPRLRPHLNIHQSKSKILRSIIAVLMLGTGLILGLVLGLGARGGGAANVPLTVDLGYSTYTGQRSTVDAKVSTWFGIRYAQAPLGDLRFAAPVAPLVDGVTYTANTHSPICRSSPSTSADPTHSEDCLFLDVYAPTTKGSYPVFVWLQSGGFNTNADPNRDGTSLIEASTYDMVVVTFNYRVGPYGFLASKEVQANGSLNNGLKDQRFVLEWIQENIHFFGGDPNRVTIGGASAGGASVDLQLSAYGGRNDNLFHAAAGESQSFGLQLTVSQSQYQYDALVSRLNCSSASDTLACLRAVDTVTLAENNPNLPTPGSAGGYPLFMWSNTMDGDFTPDFTYNLFADGKFVKVPTIFGDDTNEGTIFAPTDIATVAEMNAFLRNNFPNLTTTELAQINIYYPESTQYSGMGAYWLASANAYGEMRYNCPGIWLSGELPVQGNSRSWNYHWDVLSAANNASGYGVKHTAEAASIWGSSGSPDSALIPTIQAYWTSFIRSGDPNTYKLAASPEWTTFSRNTNRRLHFVNTVADVAMEMVPAVQSTRCAYLSSIGAEMQQ